MKGQEIKGRKGTLSLEKATLSFWRNLFENERLSLGNPLDFEKSSLDTLSLKKPL